jgi:hypothetical protein
MGGPAASLCLLLLVAVLGVSVLLNVGTIMKRARIDDFEV